MTQRHPERQESLWRLTISPGIWLAHFLASYLTAALWCAKAAGELGSLTPARWAVLVYTLLAAMGLLINGASHFRRHRVGLSAAPHELDTEQDRHRFLALAGLLLTSLSAVAVLYEAYPFLVIRSCR